MTNTYYFGLHIGGNLLVQNIRFERFPIKNFTDPDKFMPYQTCHISYVYMWRICTKRIIDDLIYLYTFYIGFPRKGAENKVRINSHTYINSRRRMLCEIETQIDSSQWSVWFGLCCGAPHTSIYSNGVAIVVHTQHNRHRAPYTYHPPHPTPRGPTPSRRSYALHKHFDVGFLLYVVSTISCQYSKHRRRQRHITTTVDLV